MGRLPPEYQLNERSGQLVLAAVAFTAAGTVPSYNTPRQAAAPFEEVRQSIATRSAPRILIFSSDAPCDVWVVWSGSGGFGGEAYFSQTFGSRLALDGRHITVSARNRFSGANQFFSSVGDGYESTHNSWVIEWAQAVPPATGFIRLPPFATGIRASSSIGLASAASIQIRNSAPTVIGVTPVVACMVLPLPVLAGADVAVLGLAAGEVVTLNFDLSL